MTAVTNERQEIIFSAAQGTIETKSTTELIIKSSTTQVISVDCECLLNVINGFVPDSFPTLNNSEETYKILINPKTSLEKILAIILSKQEIYLIRHIL